MTSVEGKNVQNSLVKRATIPIYKIAKVCNREIVTICCNYCTIPGDSVASCRRWPKGVGRVHNSGGESGKGRGSEARQGGRAGRVSNLDRTRAEHGRGKRLRERLQVARFSYPVLSCCILPNNKVTGALAGCMIFISHFVMLHPSQQH